MRFALLFCWHLHDQCPALIVVAGAGGHKPNKFRRGRDAEMPGGPAAAPVLMSTLFKERRNRPCQWRNAGSASVPTFILTSSCLFGIESVAGGCVAGGRRMPGDPQECAEQAKRCWALASKTRNPVLRESLLELAHRWSSLAIDSQEMRELLEKWGPVSDQRHGAQNPSQNTPRRR